jgi:hypothetical protein
MNAYKTCTVCKELKPLTEYCNHPSAKDGKQSKCKACNNIASLKIYKEKREQVLLAKALLGITRSKTTANQRYYQAKKELALIENQGIRLKEPSSLDRGL